MFRCGARAGQLIFLVLYLALADSVTVLGLVSRGAADAPRPPAPKKHDAAEETPQGSLATVPGGMGALGDLAY